MSFGTATDAPAHQDVAVTPLPPVVELLPHAPPMVLLDELLSCEPQRAVSAVTVRRGAPFVVADQLPTLAALELMAQTVAAFVGYGARRAGTVPRIGFLVGCREFACHRPWIAVGTELRIEVRLVFGETSLGCFSCRVTTLDGRDVATGTLSVALASDEVLRAVVADEGAAAEPTARRSDAAMESSGARTSLGGREHHGEDSADA